MKKLIWILLILGMAGPLLYLGRWKWEKADEIPKLPELEVIASNGASDGGDSLKAATSPPRAFEEFENRVASALAELPTVSDAEKTEDAHQASGLALRGGETVGAISQAVQDNPSLAPGALKFYDDCASNPDVLIAVRKVCLKRLLELSRKTGVPVDAQADRFSSLNRH